MTTHTHVEPDRAAALRFARFGTWMVQSDDKIEGESFLKALTAALHADPRVISVDAPTSDNRFSERFVRYPDMNRTSVTALAYASDGFNSFRLSDPVAFTIRVPVKNQANHYGVGGPPTDVYAVAWDGTSAVVVWDQPDALLPMNAGQVAAVVLGEVLDTIGLDLYVQGCSPHCKFLFAHTPMRLVHDPVADGFMLFEPTSVDEVQFCSPDVGGGLQVAAHEVAWALFSDLAELALAKNLGRRLLDLDESAQGDLVHLLRHYQRHTALVAAKRSWSNTKARWQNRKWRSHARDVIALLWLTISHHATLRHQWDEAARNLNSTDTREILLRGDFDDDAEAIRELGYSDLAESINHVAAGLDNRAVVAATAWGALAGGFVGGIVGAASNLIK